MTTPLWPHQQALVDFAANRDGTLWDAGMGTGKSRAAIEYRHALGSPKTLILAPLAVAQGVWPDAVDAVGLAC